MYDTVCAVRPELCQGSIIPANFQRTHPVTQRDLRLLTQRRKDFSLPIVPRANSETSDSPQPLEMLSDTDMICVTHLSLSPTALALLIYESLSRSSIFEMISPRCRKTQLKERRALLHSRCGLPAEGSLWQEHVERITCPLCGGRICLNISAGDAGGYVGPHRASWNRRLSRRSNSRNAAGEGKESDLPVYLSRSLLAVVVHRNLVVSALPYTVVEDLRAAGEGVLRYQHAICSTDQK